MQLEQTIDTLLNRANSFTKHIGVLSLSVDALLFSEKSFCNSVLDCEYEFRSEFETVAPAIRI